MAETHEHDHEHEHEHCECGCEHEHEHCGCEHEHEHEHCECGCEHEHCGCEHEHCGCEHEHEHCECGCEHEHHHHEEEQKELGREPSFSYAVLGMDCPNCAHNAQTAVCGLRCVEDARLSYATGRLDVVAKHDVEPQEAKRQVLEAIRSCGFDLDMDEAELKELSAERSWYQQNRERVLVFISGMALAAGLVTEHLMGSEQRAIPFYVVAAVAGLVFVAPMAIAAIKRKTADMNVLMGIAVLGALIMGFAGDSSVFADAAIVIFLDQIGEWLEGWSMRKTSDSIKELAKLAPDTAHLVHDGQVREVSVSSVEEGQRIRVLPGERVPLDGVIQSGASAFNEAAITGESVPVDKGAGDTVFAGSLNTTGAVELTVTADEDCTVLARIVTMVQGAQAKRAPYESFIDRFAAVYTPIVVAVAAVVGIVVPLVLSLAFGFTAELWHDWVYRALSLLVVACPCALVISTPVSFVSAITRAAKSGVLVKGGACFDVASKVDAVLFDKTGTLTSGEPKVCGTSCVNGASEQDLIAIAAALEANSTHPLGRAVCAYAAEQGISVPVAADVVELAAAGVKGSIAGAACAVGKPSFIASLAAEDESLAEVVKRFGEQGASVLAVSGGGVLAGCIAVADTVRPEASACMKALAEGGIKHTEMLTGDHEAAAAAVASAAGISRVASDLLPEDKLKRIEELRQGGETVAFVGDGINDAPALAASDLSVAMGAAASDTALEVADVALLSNGLEALPAFFSLARRTMHVVQENICFSILIKAVVFVLVIAGVVGMGWAVFADTGVALIVIFNSMRLMLKWNTRW